MKHVIMFHSVGLDRYGWMAPQIGEPVRPFEEKCRALAGAGYRSAKFTDPEIQGEPDGTPTVCLTFDDGYLDNWVHVQPALERYGLKASIFVTTDFIDPHSGLRPQVACGTLDEAQHDPAGCCAGFLSWEEMRAMEASGLVEIQSHAASHTWYASGPRIVDYWRPGAATEPGGPVWMLWNRFPDQKPFYLTRAAELERRIPWGTPVYESGKALEVRRWLPDEPGLADRLADVVEAGGAGEFFARPRWKEELDGVAASHREAAGGPAGRHEGDAEREGRIREELEGSRRILEEGLGHPVNALVWPGGGVTPGIVRMAREAGYRCFTLPAQLARDPGGASLEGMQARVNSLVEIRVKGRRVGPPSGREFLWYLRREAGDPVGQGLFRAAQLRHWIASRVGS